MNFSRALTLLKEGYFVYRKGWNGKGMQLFYVEGAGVRIKKDLDINMRDFIVMQTVDGSHIPWLASQTDILADDWVNTLDCIE